MSTDPNSRTVSAAGAHSAEWKQLGATTKSQFNEAAKDRGVSHGTSEKKTGDKARHSHDLEPSQAEKKNGAGMDKNRAQQLFQQQKSKQFDRTRSKGVGLNM